MLAEKQQRKQTQEIKITVWLESYPIILDTRVQPTECDFGSYVVYIAFVWSKVQVFL